MSTDHRIPMKLLLRFTRQSACRRFSPGSGLLLAGLTALLLAPLLALQGVETPGAQTLPPCEAAFGFESFRLGGVFGRRAETMMKGNLLQLDMEKDFARVFCHFWITTAFGIALEDFRGPSGRQNARKQPTLRKRGTRQFADTEARSSQAA